MRHGDLLLHENDERADVRRNYQISVKPTVTPKQFIAPEAYQHMKKAL